MHLIWDRSVWKKMMDPLESWNLDLGKIKGRGRMVNKMLSV